MRRELASIPIVLISLLAALPGIDARQLAFEERVTAQRRIEEVYWRHRIWPSDNPGPKPALEQVLPADRIEATVLDYLRKSTALESWWHRRIDGAQLQAEMDRMAAQSRDPAVLRELFEALGNDGYLIAETLARQSLADRLIRSWYSSDGRFHGTLASRVASARAECAQSACMREMGGVYQESTWRRRDDLAGTKAGDSNRVIELDAEEWDRQLALLAGNPDSSNATLPTGKLGAVRETGDGFSVSAVRAKSDREITVAVVHWSKQSFNSWWAAAGSTLMPDNDTTVGPFVLPSVEATACTNDTWMPTREDVPMPRFDHLAVWTGAEMLVWGGRGTSELNTGGRYSPATDSWVPTSTAAGVPTARAGARAVWTGAEMIVWGGNGSAGYVNSGGRYDPLSDHWTPVSLGANVPSPRSAFSAVWTGNEMIVWGGRGASGSVKNGGRYNPSTNLWSATSTTGSVPVARVDHTAVWTGSEMIVWGGDNGSALYSKTGGRYDPTTNLWSATSTGTNVPVPRTGHTAVWTGTEMIVWGGSGFGAGSTGGRYSPSTNSWTPTSTGANLPSARSGHTAVWTGTEMIVWGGGAALGTGGRYRPSDNAWQPIPSGLNAPTGRSAHTAVWTGDEMIVWGGSENAGSANSGGRYVPTDDSWVDTSTGTVPAPRYYHTAVWTGVEMIVWGGASFNTGGRYNAAMDTWTPTSTGEGVPAPRGLHSAVWTGREMIVWGGYVGTDDVQTGGRYDPLTDRWTPTSEAGAPSPRAGHTAVWTGKVMIIWGYWRSGGRYNPVTDTWVPTSIGPNVPEGRTDHSAIWTGEAMVVWGGDIHGTPTNTGGRYDPVADKWMPTSVGPSVPASRSGHAAVWSERYMIMWGGRSGATLLDSGGNYDPVDDNWTALVTAANTPAARAAHTVVWTGAEMIVWGGSGDVPLNTGGRYDPLTHLWTPTSNDAQAPAARERHSAVFTGTEMIVWGGWPTTFSGARYCACPSGRIVYRDYDDDGYGDPAGSWSSCSGEVPPRTSTNSSDCDDSDPDVHEGAPEICDGLDNDCDDIVDEDELGIDSDGDLVRNACDNCPLEANPAQADLDVDGTGDVCDLDDGTIMILPARPDSIDWQMEVGFETWNVYEGDLGVLAATGVYTQPAGSNPLAERHCGLSLSALGNPDNPATGKTAFALVTGVHNGVEGSLGHDSSGRERPKTSPCP